MTDTTEFVAREESFRGESGLNLVFRSWQPNGKTRAVVVIVPGFNSHGGHYLAFGAALAAAGYAAYAIDLRGRGKSDGERYYIDAFTDYVADLDGLMRIVAERETGRPVFLYGHSAGGVISCIYALEHQADLAGLICTSFAFQVPAPDFAIAALKGLSHIAPHAHVLHLKNAFFSRDPDWVAALDADPLIAHETQPTKTVAELARADDRLKVSFPQVTLPLLIMHGTEDKATRPSGSRMFQDLAGSADKTLKLYDGHYHDLLNDTGKEQVMADIIGWLDARAPKA